MSEWLDFIQAFGFPIFVAFYLLWRIEPTLNKLDNTIRLQTIVIAHMSSIDLEDLTRKFGFDEKEVRRNGK